jgi:uncharacterized protein (TIGR02271 family)
MWLLFAALVIAAVLLGWGIGGRRRSESPEERSEATVALREEQVQVRKTREHLADVDTHTEVVREMKTVTVPVAHEEFVVEKDGAEVARIPLSEERVDVSTHVVRLNDVSVYEREWTENQEIREMVRKEVARIETSGEAETREVP